MAYLKVIEGSVPGQILELTGDQVVIGRHPQCQVVLDNAAVSRHHAQILLSHGRYFLEDLRSRNGTYLNGHPLSGRTELRDRDEFDICEIVLRFFRDYPPADDESSGRDFELNFAAEHSTDGAFPAPRTGVLVPAVTEDSTNEGSSIISTLRVIDGGVDSDFRISVQPELKLRGVLEIGRALRGELNLDVALSKVLECLLRIFSQADEAAALLIEPETNQPELRATRTRREGGDVTLSRTVIDRAIETRSAILSEDTGIDQRFASSDSLAGGRLRSLMCVPLLDARGEPLGVIQLASHTVTRTFRQDDLDLLLSVASQASLTIENAALHAALLSQRVLERDLEYATQIQLSFLPRERPEIPGYQFGDFYEAAQSVGGDSFDYIPLPRGKLGISLADVAGKGVPAALLMARLSSATRFHLLTDPTVARAMEGLNSELATSGVGHRFVTCLLAILNPKTHQLRIANAGHMPPLVRAADNSITSIGLKYSGLPLGVEAGQVYKQLEITLQAGEMLFAYTDGVTEITNESGTLFGSKGLRDAIAEGPWEAEGLVRHVLNRIEEFSGKEAPRDDICIICLRRVE